MSVPNFVAFDQGTRAEAERLLDLNRKRLSEWMEALSEANAIAPDVRNLIDTLDWQLEAIRDAPPDAAGVEFGHVLGNLSWTQHQIEAVLPDLPRVPREMAVAVNSVVNVSPSGVASFVSNVGTRGTPRATDYTVRQLVRFTGLSAPIARAIRVRTLVDAEAPTVRERFDIAEREVNSWTVGIGEASSAANAMRTFIDGLQGELIAHGRKRQPRLQSWPPAELLFPIPDCDQLRDACEELRRQRPKLYEDLSAAAKLRPTRATVDALWSRTLAHAATLLELLRESRFNLRMRERGAQTP